MTKEKPALTAISTERPKNRYTTKIYFRVSPDGLLLPIVRKMRKAAHYTVTLTIDYPTYQEELKLKQEATRYDDHHHVHYLDYDTLTEARVRKCLVNWDLHVQIPGLTEKIHRQLGLLDDESMEHWQRLPPLVRKAIAIAVNESLGPA